MNDTFKLSRFVEAQAHSYDTALAEIKNGKKVSHWMWYIFPQMRGLGRTYAANFYGITGREEAAAYLAHPILGPRLKQICAAMLALPDTDPKDVLGHTDALKLRSSMTLFDIVAPGDIFDRVLEKYYNGARCKRTLAEA